MKRVGPPTDTQSSGVENTPPKQNQMRNLTSIYAARQNARVTALEDRTNKRAKSESLATTNEFAKNLFATFSSCNDRRDLDHFSDRDFDPGPFGGGAEGVF